MNQDNDNVFTDKRRLLKAFHAFKSDPSEYNFNRIAKAVRGASDMVFVTNAVTDFAQSISGRPRYSDFVQSFDELQQ